MNNLIKQIVESKYNFNIDIEGNEKQTSLSKSKYNSITQKKIIEQIVDLGLPSGTLWHKYNLDVEPNQLSKPEDWYGKYYAWGELEGNKTENRKFYFSRFNYKFGNGYNNELTKYCNNPIYGLNGSFFDNLTELLPEDDAVCQNKKLQNFKFHIPTKKQCEELINYTDNYWVKNYDPNKLKHDPEDDKGIKGLNGRVFEGKNENQLFIPAAGFCSNDITYYTEHNNYDVGFNCNLWSSSLDLDNPKFACYLYFRSDRIHVSNNNRYQGLSIHPVLY